MDNRDLTKEKNLEKKPLKAYEIDAVKGAVDTLFSAVEGADKSLMRRFARQFETTIKDIADDYNEIVRKYGKESPEGPILTPPTDKTDKESIERYNKGIKLLKELMQMETDVVPPKVWHVEYMDQLEISNGDITALIQFGFVYDPDDPKYQEVKEPAPEEEEKGGLLDSMEQLNKEAI